MPATAWDQRFFATTRGRLLQHLRRRAATVDELAQALDLTDNAIRAQLALLTLAALWLAHPTWLMVAAAL